MNGQRGPFVRCRPCRARRRALHLEEGRTETLLPGSENREWRESPILGEMSVPPLKRALARAVRAAPAAMATEEEWASMAWTGGQASIEAASLQGGVFGVLTTEVRRDRHLGSEGEGIEW